MDFEKMMKAIEGGNPWGPKGTAKELMAAADKAAEKQKALESVVCPFKVGDYVTPKSGSGKKGRGLAMKVVETFPVKQAVYDRGSGIEVSNMKTVVAFSGGDVMAFFEHSDKYELFDSEKVSKSAE